MVHAEIVFIVGPTAVGKTDVAVSLAHSLKGEIVNADAMQIYREVSILNNKPDAVLMRAVPHHLFGILSVRETFDVAAYNQIALKTIAGIRKRKRLPIVVGGSGLYVRVLLDGIFDQPAGDPGLRRRMEHQADQDGPETLHRRLQEVDPDAAARIHARDTRRIVRALEVFEARHQPISRLQQGHSGLWGRHDLFFYGLKLARPELIRRIDLRVEQMFAAGAVVEVRRLAGMPLSRTARGMIGIQEIQGYLAGEYDLMQAMELIKIHTRQYAKRQMTWFRKEKRLRWVTLDPKKGSDEVVAGMAGEIRERAKPSGPAREG